MKRFKLIYYYDETADKVFMLDIWDMRRNPKSLVSEFKISKNSKWQS